MRRALASLASALALSCFDGPTAGEVTLSLVTPNTDDGAVAFMVTVPAPNEITGASAACDGCDVFVAKVSATELRGIVTGDLAAGPVVRLAVSQAGPDQVYHVQVLAVASRQFAERAPSRYTLSVHP
ncbi:MAG: hypothetical protein HYW52_05215 [Gemmatimonadetes bacterium]|nr:hypothetical protein [Gemmatimonadota bacterium]